MHGEIRVESVAEPPSFRFTQNAQTWGFALPTLSDNLWRVPEVGGPFELHDAIQRKVRCEGGGCGERQPWFLDLTDRMNTVGDINIHHSPFAKGKFDGSLSKPPVSLGLHMDFDFVTDAPPVVGEGHGRYATNKKYNVVGTRFLPVGRVSGVDIVDSGSPQQVRLGPIPFLQRNLQRVSVLNTRGLPAPVGVSNVVVDGYHMHNIITDVSSDNLGELEVTGENHGPPLTRETIHPLKHSLRKSLIVH